MQQRNAEKAAGNYNARIANLQADNKKQKGLEAVAEHARRVAQLKSQQRAGMSANGLDLTSDIEDTPFAKDIKLVDCIIENNKNILKKLSE